MRHVRISAALCALLLWAGAASDVRAEAGRDRFNAGGYFRTMARPDFQGGDARLGYWNLYGRLLNEGPWAILDMDLDLMQRAPRTGDIWSRVHARIEGDSIGNTDGHMGRLDRFALTQLYVQIGNVLFPNVTWQVGTLHHFFGDLSLYDLRPADLFYDTAGLSATLTVGPVEVVAGVGDAGYFIRRDAYSTILTGGAAAKLRIGEHLELAVGGQTYWEPRIEGNRFAPHRTRVGDYEDYVRGELVRRYLERYPGREDVFPKPEAISSSSYRAIAYVGFGKLGPLVWDNLYASFTRRHPETTTTESYGGREYTLYVHDFTDERYELMVGNEAHIKLIPETLDLLWAQLFGYQVNADNEIAAGEDNRTFFSTVARFQYYVTPTVHLLLENSLAREKSHNGNLWREHYNSIFAGTDRVADVRGLEHGDTDHRDTYQFKTGIVLNPSGVGIFSRPSLRILYGVQVSNVHNAFSNSFVETLDAFDEFRETGDRHIHSLVAIEAEAWF